MVMIDDEMIEYVGILAQLELNAEEKKQAGKDMAQMLEYFGIMGELDTRGVEPMSHIFQKQNVFREDVVTSVSDSAGILANAPLKKEDMFVVPPTFEG